MSTIHTAPSEDASKEVVYSGIPVSPGIAIGAALVIGKKFSKVTKREIKPEEVDSQIKLFHRALEKTRDQIRILQHNLHDSLKKQHSGIFDAHVMITQDKMVLDEVEKAVKTELLNVDYLFHRTIKKYIIAISSMDDDYISERADDIQDVASRVIMNIHGGNEVRFDNIPGSRIIIAHDLTPSDTASFNRENVLAFATVVGSRTSHTAIMARSMEIPAIVGLVDEEHDVDNGDIVVIDGYKGRLITNPTADTLDAYASRETREEEIHDEILGESTLPSETVDRFNIELAANIELPQDIDTAKRYGAAGIGLYRTEYLYINRVSPPSVEEQFDVYRDILRRLDGKSLIIRTFDIGGDKLGAMFESPHLDANPFLGCRAIRLRIDYPHLLNDQIKAILMASAFGNIKIMFPMIACMDEVGHLNGLVDNAKRELSKDKIDFNDDLEVGIMIETPAAAMIAENLATKVDFFSIGTNDLVQYALAVDRSNEKVAYLCQPAHPAILKLIKRTVDAAKENGIWVGICGEMAGDPRYTPLLVGMGVHELSMSPSSIGQIRRLIRKLYLHDAEKLLEKVLKMSTEDEVLDITENLLYELAPDIMNMVMSGE